jgi:hypothetical protein
VNEKKNLGRRKDGKGGFARLFDIYPKCRLHRKKPRKTKTLRKSPNSNDEGRVQNLVRAFIDDANNNNVLVMFLQKNVPSTSNL